MSTPPVLLFQSERTPVLIVPLRTRLVIGVVNMFLDPDTVETRLQAAQGAKRTIEQITNLTNDTAFRATVPDWFLFTSLKYSDVLVFRDLRKLLPFTTRSVSITFYTQFGLEDMTRFGLSLEGRKLYLNWHLGARIYPTLQVSQKHLPVPKFSSNNKFRPQSLLYVS